MRNNQKIAFAGLMGVALMWFARAMAQTNSVPITTLPGGNPENIVAASWYQVLNNPASLTLIPFLCVLAWLADDLPFINSRYVAHITVILGMSLYWLFAGPSSVPKSFPYPEAVLVSNGTICGFVAFVVHRQAVARLIAFCRQRTGQTEFIKNPNPPSPGSSGAASPPPPAGQP